MMSVMTFWPELMATIMPPLTNPSRITPSVLGLEKPLNLPILMKVRLLLDKSMPYTKNLCDNSLVLPLGLPPFRAGVCHPMLPILRLWPPGLISKMVNGPVFGLGFPWLPVRTPPDNSIPLPKVPPVSKWLDHFQEQVPVCPQALPLREVVHPHLRLHLHLHHPPPTSVLEVPPA